MADRTPGGTSGVDAAAEEHIAAKLGLDEDTQSLERMLSMPSVAFEILSQSYRRHVVRYLLDNETPVELGELARYVAARERQTSPAAVTAGERDEVAVRLVHVHIPKMVDFDLIEWVPERGEILLSTDDGIERDEATPGAADVVDEVDDHPDA